mgnify:CR=1 FL=1
MSTTNRIEAAIKAEAKRIEAWNSHEFYPISGPMTTYNIRSLASYLVRNRIQVQDAQKQTLVVALRSIAEYPEDRVSRGGEQYLRHIIAWCQGTANAALKVAGEDA